MAGKIDQRSLYRIRSMDATASRILKGVEVKTAGNLLSAFIRYLQGEGIEILDPTPFLESFFPAEGNLTRHVAISPEVRQEMEFGWKAAKVLADLDIGQTVVVKNRAVVAVEGIEGTDETILRGGRMAGKGTVVVKVGRTSQDPRIDLPAVGLGTIRSLARIRAAALCLEARKMPFFHQEAALLLAESRGIAVMARSA
jgi:DUF1009 family protein